MVDEDETWRLDSGASGERWLVVLAGPEATSVRLPAAGALVVGRSPKCDIIIPDRSVSREHLRLIVAGDVFVEDLGSANGTRVGGIPVAAHEKVRLAAGMLVDVGSVGIMIRAGAAPSPSHVPAAAASVTVERVARSSLTVLIQGETGSGKELMAESIHRLSPRASMPLLRLNCAAISDTLMESELFGHERGAFTGAVASKLGLLETAEGGTVFLDEIGDLGLPLQAKLLRVLEERKVWRVGALKPVSIDVRFVAATHRDLEEAAIEGKFRRDLLFRLNAITLRVPPLRERTGEIPALAQMFIDEACASMSRPALHLDGGALQALLRHDWPGNIRELKNVISRTVAMCDGPTIEEAHLSLPREGGRTSVAPREHVPTSSGHGARSARSLAPQGTLHDDVEALEQDRILKALEACDYNRTRAAQMLGIARNTLASRMARFAIRVPGRD